MWIGIAVGVVLFAFLAFLEIMDSWWYCHCPNGESDLDENLKCRKCNGHMYSGY